MLAISIWSVEELLGRNISGASRSSDSQWTFGQIAALILLAGPLFTFARAMRAVILGETVIRSGSQQVLTDEDYARAPTRTGTVNVTEDEKVKNVSYRMGEVRALFPVFVMQTNVFPRLQCRGISPEICQNIFFASNDY